MCQPGGRGGRGGRGQGRPLQSAVRSTYKGLRFVAALLRALIFELFPRALAANIFARLDGCPTRACQPAGSQLIGIALPASPMITPRLPC